MTRGVWERDTPEIAISSGFGSMGGGDGFLFSGGTWHWPRGFSAYAYAHVHVLVGVSVARTPGVFVRQTRRTAEAFHIFHIHHSTVFG